MTEVPDKDDIEIIKPKMGRPKINIDWDQFERMCEIQCTSVEICAVLDIHIDTLREKVKEHFGVTFSEVFAQYKQVGKMSLRRKQFRLANGNSNMAIFLGKNWLGQRDTVEIDTNKPIVLNYNLDKSPDEIAEKIVEEIGSDDKES